MHTAGQLVPCSFPDLYTTFAATEHLSFDRCHHIIQNNKTVGLTCATLEMHAGCMQAALRRYAGGCRMQQPACRRLQVAAACMQPACRLHAACITLQVKPPPLKNTCTFPASTPCAGRQRPASRGRRPAHRRRRPACRLQAGCMQGVDAKKIRRE